MAAKILGLFERLMGKQRMRKSSRKALNLENPIFPSGSSAKQGIPSPCPLFHRYFCSTQHNPCSTSPCAFTILSIMAIKAVFDWLESMPVTSVPTTCGRGSGKEDHVTLKPHIPLPYGNQKWHWGCSALPWVPTLPDVLSRTHTQTHTCVCVWKCLTNPKDWNCWFLLASGSSCIREIVQ